MKDNRLTIRYIFEIIVIVFSVTISFYIQEVQNRNEKLLLKNESLKGVISDLEKDKAIFEFAKNFNEMREKNVDTIISKEYAVNQYNITDSKGDMPMIPHNSNYNSMLTTGSIEFIKNKELFNSINEYYSTFYNLYKDRASKDEKLTWKYIEYLQENYRLDSIGIDYRYDGYSQRRLTHYSDREFDKMNDDFILKNILWDFKIWIREYSRTINEGTMNIEKLEGLIKDEINLE
tara:strand:+ start:131 stop:829 length:699 start_codon:yes stop_codon:yes gene_type:complete